MNKPREEKTNTEKTILEEFDKQFIYDEFDYTRLMILGNRQENAPASDEEVKEFISQALTLQRESVLDKFLVTCYSDIVFSKDQVRCMEAIKKQIIKESK